MTCNGWKNVSKVIRSVSLRSWEQMGDLRKENNETGEEVQEEQCLHAEVEEEVIQ
jgi:hypothetical protein